MHKKSYLIADNTHKCSHRCTHRGAHKGTDTCTSKHIYTNCYLWRGLCRALTLFWGDVDVLKQTGGVDGGNVSFGLLEVVHLACESRCGTCTQQTCSERFGYEAAEVVVVVVIGLQKERCTQPVPKQNGQIGTKSTGAALVLYQVHWCCTKSLVLHTTELYLPELYLPEAHTHTRARTHTQSTHTCKHTRKYAHTHTYPHIRAPGAVVMCLKMTSDRVRGDVTGCWVLPSMNVKSTEPTMASAHSK